MDNDVKDKDVKNTLGLTEKEMQVIYHDKVDKVTNNPVNAHKHWFNKKGYCNICSKKAA
jgi:hypothetical protein